MRSPSKAASQAGRSSVRSQTPKTPSVPASSTRQATRSAPSQSTGRKVSSSKKSGSAKRGQLQDISKSIADMGRDLKDSNRQSAAMVAQVRYDHSYDDHKI